MVIPDDTKWEKLLDSIKKIANNKKKSQEYFALYISLSTLLSTLVRYPKIAAKFKEKSQRQKILTKALDELKRQIELCQNQNAEKAREQLKSRMANMSSLSRDALIRPGSYDSRPNAVATKNLQSLTECCDMTKLVLDLLKKDATPVEEARIRRSLNAQQRLQDRRSSAGAAGCYFNPTAKTTRTK